MSTAVNMLRAAYAQSVCVGSKKEYVVLLCLCMFSLRLYGFPLGAPVSTEQRHTGYVKHSRDYVFPKAMNGIINGRTRAQCVLG